MNVDAAEVRVLGCLLEKQRTTPDVYPLTLNALRLACNQATNRDPVVDYDEAAVGEALSRLRERRWVRVATLPGRRTVKYRQMLDEALGLAPDELAVLAVLMLRGPQTPGELKQRSGRLHPFADLGEVVETLDRLHARELAVRLGRRPGEKQERYAHALGGAGADPEDPESATLSAEAPEAGELEARVEHLERSLAELRSELADLRRRSGG